MASVEPSASVEQLLGAIRRGGDEAKEAALALGLLLEEVDPEDAPGIVESVGWELAERRLSEAERDTAVNGLLAYLREEAEPHASAVWALTKSYESRIVPALIELLDSGLDDPRDVHLAYQALVGIATSGLTAPEYHNEARSALERAAARGPAELAETARSYLSAQF